MRRERVRRDAGRQLYLLRATLAGYTAIIVASTLTETPQAVFVEAVSRASEIAIGIVCATVVLTVTSRARAAGELAGALAGIVTETASGTLGTLHQAGSDMADTRPARPRPARWRIKR